MCAQRAAPPPPATVGEPVASVPPTPKIPLPLAAAVRSALAQHPAIAQARAQVGIARGQVRSQRGAFDATLGGALGWTRNVARVFTAPDPLKQTSTDTNWSLDATKSFLTGTQLEATVALDNLAVAPPSGPGLKTGAVNLAVTQPLLRNAGTIGAASALRAAQHAERATEFIAEHTAQSQVLGVVLAYFGVAAAGQSLALAQTSFERGTRILDETRILVQADQRPRGDLRALQGNVESRRRDVISAQTERIRALSALRLAMGLDVQSLVDFDPTDALPEPPQSGIALTRLTEEALAARADLKAVQASVDSAAVLYRGADHNALPKLDVTVNAGYEGTLTDSGAGAFFATVGHPAGLNAGAKLALELPIENNALQGVRDAAAAGVDLARSQLYDQTRTVRSEVAAAYEDLRLSVDQVSAARAAEQHYDFALTDEREKLRAGLATVIDVVLTEELLTAATRSRIAAQLELATALAQLRFAQGAMPGRDDAVAPFVADLISGGSHGER